MTIVLIKAKAPTAEGDAPAAGFLEWVPTRRRTVGDVVVLPAPFRVRLVSGAGSVDVPPTAPEWVWKVTESLAGLPKVTRYVAVPAGAAISYTELVDVDPSTLEPTADPEAAWWAALRNAELGVSAIVDPDDPGALILHFQSWQLDPADSSILIMPIQEA